MSIGERILAIAKSKKISQTDIAKKIGVAQSSVSQWKTGSVPSSDKIVPIAEILGVSIEYLLTGKEDVPKIVKPNNSREIARLEGRIEEQKERIMYLENQNQELIKKLSPAVDNRQNKQ